uniref:SAC domain-containing protein n=1 Tax=Timema cristinae TaxID=61476 RepID=A0A7R9CDJ4_TIMCR|nr:unnamed protein product [Timema cristinae]
MALKALLLLRRQKPLDSDVTHVTPVNRGMHFENVSVLIGHLVDVIKDMGYCWRDKEGQICSQKGVFRVNCIDCLDRTNVVQRLPSLYFPPAPRTQMTHHQWMPIPSQAPPWNRKPSPSTAPLSAPLTFTRPCNEETWQRSAPDCTYEEYIAADITVWGTLDAANIIREQQESCDEEGEEEMEEEPEDIPTTKDVLKA